ncbi:MAG: hypothetical protein KGZ39_00240 [Simkania sp.]|nr:hypothetical protein [Simkania sp.]
MVINNVLNAQVQGLQNFNSTTGVWTGRTITNGGGVSVSNGDGTSGNPTITVIGGGMTWNVVSGTSDSMATNNGYMPTNASSTSLLLPATANVGDIVAICGTNANGGYIITQNAGQSIQMSATGAVTTVGVTGQLNCLGSTTICLICITVDTTWHILWATGSNFQAV